MTSILYTAELTDTFAGEANYCWVQRATFEAPSDASPRTLLARAKRALNTTLAFRTTFDCGDHFRADAQRACICLFISVGGA